jgi:hypothetical protein
LSDSGPSEDEPAAFPADEDDKLAAAAAAMAQDAGTAHLLARLLRLSPFLDLHDRAGGHHPWRSGICFFFDFLLRLAVVTALLAIVVGVAWKTLAPLPRFWD